MTTPLASPLEVTNPTTQAFPVGLPAASRITYDTSGLRAEDVYTTWGQVQTVAQGMAFPIVLVKNGSIVPAGTWSMGDAWGLESDGQGIVLADQAYFDSNPIYLDNRGGDLLSQETHGGSHFTLTTQPGMVILNSTIHLSASGALIDGTVSGGLLRLVNVQVTAGGGQQFMLGDSNHVTGLVQTFLGFDVLPNTMILRYDDTSDLQTQHGNAGEPLYAPPIYTSFVFQPGGTPSFNVFTTEGQLASATLFAVGAPYSVYFDLGFVGGSYTFTTSGLLDFAPNGTWTSGGFPITLTFNAETELVGFPAVWDGAIAIVVDQTNDLWGTYASGYGTELRGSCTVETTGAGGAFINSTGGPVTVRFKDQARCSGPNVVLVGNSGGTIVAWAEDSAVIETGSFDPGTVTVNSVDESIAVGVGCTTTHAGAVAVGRGCAGHAAGATAIGDTCIASIQGDVALGYHSTTGGSSFASVAMGDTCTTDADGGVAIGWICAASGEGAVAIGYNCLTAFKSVAIGEASAQFVNGVAIGVGSQTSADYQFNIGGDSDSALVGARSYLCGSEAGSSPNQLFRGSFDLNMVGSTPGAAINEVSVLTLVDGASPLVIPIEGNGYTFRVWVTAIGALNAGGTGSQSFSQELNVYIDPTGPTAVLGGSSTQQQYGKAGGGSAWTLDVTVAGGNLVLTFDTHADRAAVRLTAHVVFEYNNAS